MNRRSFLSVPAAMALAGSHVEAAPMTFPIIDTHIHLFDPTRPQGVPWPDKTNATLYKPALPSRYRGIATPHGIVGAIEVECSPLADDNQWVLDVMEKDKIMVGTVGDLEPDKPDFHKRLDNLHRNPMFLGIRYGNLWGRNLGTQLSNREFIAGIKAMADAGLELDTANPNPALLDEVIKLSDMVPNLRIVIDHLPQLEPPSGAARASYVAKLHEIGKRKQIYVKISEVLRRVNGQVPEDPAFYRPRLDELFGVFGEDRVLYGSDWPNSDTWAPYDKVFHVVHDYFTRKGQAVAEKYFWKNSIAAYRWKKRDASQPSL